MIRPIWHGMAYMKHKLNCAAGVRSYKGYSKANLEWVSIFMGLKQVVLWDVRVSCNIIRVQRSTPSWQGSRRAERPDKGFEA